MTVTASAPDGRLARGGLLLAALAAPLLFAAFTSQVWEDYYITYRSSRNLVEGHGLVYQVGERVHTFTSPLGVLLPAFSLAAGGSDTAALWIFRGLCALALGVTAVLLARHARAQGWGAAIGGLAVCLGLFEAKVVAFSANGMETAFLLLFAILAWTELCRHEPVRIGRIALAYAGLMWTRPDACVLAAAMTLAAGAFRERGAPGSARAWWLAVLTGIGLGALLYLPWPFWAWSYYGSPIPQTIIAKSIYTPGFSPLGLLTAPVTALVSNTALDDLFMPIYGRNGWPDALIVVGRVLARAAILVWLIPAVARPARAASLTLLIGSVYLQQIMPYPWYFAPWTLLGALALAGAGHAALAKLPPAGRGIGRVLAGVIAGGALLVTVAQAHTARVQQQEIEESGRKAIGLWLKKHAAPSDRLFLEPVGYIGYFSGLKILDFPGLCAPEVSAIVRSGPGGYARLIRELNPDWLVLRPYEIAHQNLQDSGSLAGYEPVLYSNRREALAAHTFLPGRNWPEFDAEFVVYRRR